MSDNVNTLADSILTAVNGYVSRSLASLSAKVDELAVKVAGFPVPKDGRDGVDGANGQDGRDGKDVDEGALAQRIANAVRGEVAAIPVPKDGQNGADGKSADMDALRALIVETVKAEIAKLPAAAPGRDGKDASEELVRPLLDTMVREAVAAIPKASDGLPGMDGLPGNDGQDGADGQDGKPGPAGRDAIQIEPMALDASRCYSRGSWASYGGGLLRAARSTEPLEGKTPEAAGWEVMVSGVSDVRVELAEDERTFCISVNKTSGDCERTYFVLPVMLHRGVWTQREYQKGDVVTRDGSCWHAQKQTDTEPGLPSAKDDWKLIVKRGRDGAAAPAFEKRPIEPVKLR